MDRPRWLSDVPEVEALFSDFLNKLDKKPYQEWKKTPEIKINKKSLKGLYRLDAQAQQQWALLQSLAPAIYTIRPSKKRDSRYDPEFHQVSLLVSEEGEAILRAWFNRPLGMTPTQQWLDAIDRHQNQFSGDGELLRSRRFTVEAMTDEDVLQALLALAQYRDRELSLRQLSALCFRGNSKILDNKEDVILSLYPELKIKPRPVLVSVYLPRKIESVLFIENQDTYNSLKLSQISHIANTALVYCSGFQGTAARIRERSGVSLHYQGHVGLQSIFERSWFDIGASDWENYFWGDLDFAGMSILKVLRCRFESIQAWQTGYEPMYAMMEQGGGYTSDQNQSDPQKTGCDHADQVLLPMLRKSKRSIDQEAVIFS